MKMTNRTLLGLALTAAVATAHATPDEDRLLATLKKAHPATHFTGISRTPIPGFYEVWMGANVAFVSNRNTRYLVFGRLFDTVAMQDVTAPKLAKIAQRRVQEQEPEKTAVQIDQLPLADAIKIVKGNGTRQMVVFSDPACGYCKRLEPELDKLDNVTIHTFLVPFQGEAKPVAIWCANDRQLAWRQTMLQNDASALNASVNCPHPIDRNLALAQRLKVRGTPTMFFADGHRVDGYTDATEIEAHLSVPSHQVGSPSTVSIKEKS